MSGGFVAHIISAYSGLRTSMREQMNRQVAEEHLLALAAFGSFVVFLSFLPTLFGTDLRQNSEQSLAAGVIMWFFVVMFFLPLALYGIAFVSHVISRKLDGTGSGFDARHALFWALAVLSPVLITKAMIGNVIMQLGGTLTPALLGALNLALLFAILRVWGAMLAEAEGFRSTTRVTLGITAVFVLLYGIIYVAAL